MDQHPEGMTHDATLDMGFRQTTDPQVDTVDALYDHGAVCAFDQRDVRVDLLECCDRLTFQNQIRVGLLELGDLCIRQTVPRLEVIPRSIGGHVHVRLCDRFHDVGVGGRRQIGFDLVERSETQIAATGDIEGEEVSGATHQIGTDRVDHHRVNLFRRLFDQTAKDVRHTMLGIARLRNIAHLCQDVQRIHTCQHRRFSVVVVIDLEGFRIVRRIQEQIVQRDFEGVTIGILERHHLPDLRVTEAVGRTCELVADASIGIRVVLVMAMATRALQTAQKGVGKVVEHNLLILTDVQDPRSMEQLIEGTFKSSLNDVFHVVVVVTRPNRVHRGQTDVLVRAPVAAHVVVEKVHERVGVDQKRPALTHEVARKHLHLCSIVVAIAIPQTRIVLEQRHAFFRQARTLEHSARVDVVIQRLTQCRHKLEALCRRIIRPHQDLRAEAALSIAFTKELTDQRGRTVDLVLVDHRRGEVLMQRRAVCIIAHHVCTGQVGWIVIHRVAGCPHATDLDRSKRITIGTGPFRDEREAVVEVLTKGHHEHVGRGRLGRIRVLSAQCVRKRPCIQPIEDRVNDTRAVFADTGIACLGHPHVGQGRRTRDVGV